MAKKKSAAAASVPVESLKHPTDTRPNIPTRETAAFAGDDGPQKFVVNRDRSLDPQLVWKGKDEQDAKPLDVPAVPIHVQEKIDPLAIVRDVRRRATGEAAPTGQLALFDAFEEPDDFSKRLEFYQHDNHWTNRLILGDSLLVMASLAEKERLRGKVQCVYFDPPYGIKFGSNWQISTRNRDVKDARAEDLTRQPEQVQAFRDTWELGIHSYLSYMRDRLAAARELLTESGSIFVQIGDENVHLVRGLLDEVFGSHAFVSQIVYAKTSGATGAHLAATADYILWYAKDKEHLKSRRLFLEKQFGEQGATKYDQVELSDGSRRALDKMEKLTGSFEGRAYCLDNMMSQSSGREKGEGAACWYRFEVNGNGYYPTAQRRWQTTEEGMRRLLFARRLQPMSSSLRYVRFLDDFPAYPLVNTWMDIGGVQSRTDPKIYIVPYR